MILLNWRSDRETSSPPVPQPSLQSLLELVVLALPELPDHLSSCCPGSPCSAGAASKLPLLPSAQPQAMIVSNTCLGVHASC